jgi:hypothetical protein
MRFDANYSSSGKTLIMGVTNNWFSFSLLFSCWFSVLKYPFHWDMSYDSGECLCTDILRKTKYSLNDWCRRLLTYGRHPNLIDRYEISVSNLTVDMSNTAVSFKKRNLPTFRESTSSPPIMLFGVRVAHNLHWKNQNQKMNTIILPSHTKKTKQNKKQQKHQIYIIYR